MKTVTVKEMMAMQKETIVSIYKDLNQWKWSDLLGDAPEGWDEMPKYKKPYMSEDVITKADIIRPYASAIKQKYQEIRFLID